MAKLSGKPPRIELYCKKNDDGSYDAGIKEDGTPLAAADYIVLKGDCDDLQELWKRARDKYSVNPEIGNACKECFSESFLEGESL